MNPTDGIPGTQRPPCATNEGHPVGEPGPARPGAYRDAETVAALADLIHTTIRDAGADCPDLSDAVADDRGLCWDVAEAVQRHTAPENRPAPTGDLAEAESWARKLATLYDNSEWLPALMAEYDRRGAVEQAAAAYVLAGLCGDPDTSAELTALIAAVRTNRSFRG